MGLVGAEVDSAAWEGLYRARYEAMLRLAVLLLGSRAIAEEAVHDAFLKVRHRMAALGEPAAYLRRTVVNECRQRQRRLGVEERYRPTPPSPVLPPEIDEMWARIVRLPPRRRTAVVLRFYEDRSIDEIADLMGCRPGTVSSLLHRALASLRKEIEGGRS